MTVALVLMISSFCALLAAYVMRSRLLTSSWKREERWQEMLEESQKTVKELTDSLNKTTKNLEWATAELAKQRESA